MNGFENDKLCTFYEKKNDQFYNSAAKLPEIFWHIKCRYFSNCQHLIFLPKTFRF